MPTAIRGRAGALGLALGFLISVMVGTPPAKADGAIPTGTANLTVVQTSAGPDVRAVGSITVSSTMVEICSVRFRVINADGSFEDRNPFISTVIDARTSGQPVAFDARYLDGYAPALFGFVQVAVVASCVGDLEVVVELARVGVTGPAFEVEAPQAWYPDSTAYNSPGRQQLLVSFNAPSAPVSVQVTTATGTLIGSLTRDTALGYAIPVRISAKAYGRLTLTVTAGGQSVQRTVTSYKGWAVKTGALPAFRRCDVLTWRYDGSKAPKGSDSTMRAELRRVFGEYGRLTGMRFVEGPTDRGNSIVVRWADVSPALARGGFRTTTTGAGSVTSGELVLNPRRSQMRKAGWTYPARGPVLFHEVGHVLGLAHVSVPSSLMYPVYGRGTSPKPATAEKQAMAVLYQPQTCTPAS